MTELLREAARRPDLHARPIFDDWYVCSVDDDGNSVPWPDPDLDYDGVHNDCQAIERALVSFARSVRDDDPAGAA